MQMNIKVVTSLPHLLLLFTNKWKASAAAGARKSTLLVRIGFVCECEIITPSWDKQTSEQSMKLADYHGNRLPAWENVMKVNIKITRLHDNYCSRQFSKSISIAWIILIIKYIEIGQICITNQPR
jgi:hypothetical protein